MTCQCVDYAFGVTRTCAQAGYPLGQMCDSCRGAGGLACTEGKRDNEPGDFGGMPSFLHGVAQTAEEAAAFRAGMARKTSAEEHKAWRDETRAGARARLLSMGYTLAEGTIDGDDAVFAAPEK